MEQLAINDTIPEEAANPSKTQVPAASFSANTAEEEALVSSDSENEEQDLGSTQQNIKNRRRVQNAKFEDLYFLNTSTRVTKN